MCANAVSRLLLFVKQNSPISKDEEKLSLKQEIVLLLQEIHKLIRGKFCFL